MRALMLIVATTLIASCSRPVTPPGSSFAEETAGRVAGPAQSCINSHQGVNLRVVDSQTLAFNDGPTIWITHLGAPCPGIQTLSTLIVQPELGGQYCRGDHVRGLEQGAIIPGATCFIGNWVPYRKP
ncbi:MAG TPA: hypothetical protein VK192_10955 [Sphingomicrobium sp.]|jgi:hypothetical protein|nr:hypothetical protein [Sphingomicrobium sp.]